MRKLLLFVALAVLASAGSALAIDRDNNGIQNDETYSPGVFNGNPNLDETVLFPTSADTWNVTYYPYWWNAGDTVYGNHTVAMGSVSHVDLALKIDYTVLNGGGHVDLDFRINGTTVGSFSITEADGSGTVYHSFDFAPVTPPFELRYYETNTVGGGLGSVSLNESGLSSATFSGGGTPVQESSWGRVKSLYR